jgi:phage terminase small subunit
MGLRGPKPKPAHLKALAGNPGKRKARPSAGALSERPDAPPAAPKYLGAIARQWWAVTVPVLHREGKLATLALKTLEMAAEAYASWRTYEAEAKAMGAVAAVQTGIRAAADRASSRYIQAMARFGGDPQSHGSLKGLPAAPDADDVAREKREGFFGVPGGREA